VRQYQKIFLVISSIFFLAGVTLVDPINANGQSKWKIIQSQESGRDPFSLPAGVRLLSQMSRVTEPKGIPSKTETKLNEVLPSLLKVNAILISDHIRLALIDRHIVTVGDSIHDEKVLEIKNNQVVLGKDNQKRTLLLSQSLIPLTVEERPPTLTILNKEGEKKGKGE
jgi:hypothetical protein